MMGKDHTNLASILLFLSTLLFPLVIANESTGNGSDDIYTILQVQPPTHQSLTFWRRFSWRWHGRLLPLFHLWDDATTRDVYVNLRVLWNKALASVDPKSLTYESPLFCTYHMLPWYSRWILVFPSPRWFPRWFHANIELRTVYLNQAIRKEIQWAKQQRPDTKIRVILLGGGYDTRSIRLLLANGNEANKSTIEEAWELDLPQVIESKTILLKRLYRHNIPNKNERDRLENLHLRAIDLNQLHRVRSLLTTIVNAHKDDNGENDDCWYTILVSEAVLLYLEKPSELIRLCSELLNEKTASFCFVDRFDAIKTKADIESGRRYLANVGGWNLMDWLIKPGATRHMGIARL